MIIGKTKFKEKKATIPKLVSSCCHQNWNSSKNLKMEDFIFLNACYREINSKNPQSSNLEYWKI